MLLVVFPPMTLSERMTMKLCSKCKVSKSLDSFPPRKDRKSGLHSWCRSCKQNYKNPHRIFKKNECESCSFKALHECQLDIDHIDGNHSNNDPNNLQTLCANCHRIKTQLNKENIKTNLRMVK
jgi:5-methylcytosine-specific restriction endonuclease McrA